MGQYPILRQRAGTLVITGFVPDVPPKLVSFWDTRRETTLSNQITSRTAWIPRTALTGKGITGLDITISPIGTVLAYLNVKHKLNPL